MTNIYFQFRNSVSQFLSSSKVTLIQRFGPIANSDGSIAYNGPIPLYTNINGEVTFPNVPAAIYEITITNSGYGNNPYYINYAPEILYIDVPETNGGSITGSNYLLASLPPPNLSGSYYALFANSSSYALSASWSPGGGGPSVSSSYALTASYAANSSDGSSISSSWASSSLSSSYASTTNYATSSSVICPSIFNICLLG